MRQDASDSVSSAELVRSFGLWQSKAISGPVVITHHGREKLILLSAEHYRQMDDGGQSQPKTGVHYEYADMVLEHMSQAFMAFDSQWIVTYANPAACAHYRLSREQVVGRRLQDSVPQIVDSLAFAYLRRVAATGETETFEAPSVVYPGTWLQFCAFPTQEGAGLMSRSIADELSYRRAADFKRAMVDAISRHGEVGYAQMNGRGLFERVNESLPAMMDLQPDRLLGARLTDILPTRCRSRAAEAVEQILAGAEGLVFDSALLKADGQERHVRIVLSGLRGQFATEGAVAIVTPSA